MRYADRSPLSFTLALQSAFVRALLLPMTCPLHLGCEREERVYSARLQAAHAALNIEADGTAATPSASELLFSFERSQSSHQLKSGGAEDDAALARKGSSGDLQHVVALGRPGTEFEQQVCSRFKVLQSMCAAAPQACAKHVAGVSDCYAKPTCCCEQIWTLCVFHSWRA